MGGRPLFPKGVLYTMFQNNLAIVGKDGTKYIIPVTSLASININITIPAIHFNLVPAVWQDSGCKSFGISVSSLAVIENFVSAYYENGGRCPVRYV